VLTEVGDLNKKVVNVNTGVDKLTQSINTLEKTISGLNGELASLKQMQQRQNAQLTDITGQLTGLATPASQTGPKQVVMMPAQTEIELPSNNAVREMPNMNTPNRAQAVAPTQSIQNSPGLDEAVANEFIIEAVIPGRAWLRTPDGLTITVTEGDSLGNLGKVVMIDAQNSSIVTSSGVVLRN